MACCIDILLPIKVHFSLSFEYWCSRFKYVWQPKLIAYPPSLRFDWLCLCHSKRNRGPFFSQRPKQPRPLYFWYCYSPWIIARGDYNNYDFRYAFGFLLCLHWFLFINSQFQILLVSKNDFSQNNRNLMMTGVSSLWMKNLMMARVSSLWMSFMVLKWTIMHGCLIFDSNEAWVSTKVEVSRLNNA